jgi:ribosomal protein S4E
MEKEEIKEVLKDGDFCLVTAGTHKGKSGTVRDLNISKTGHLTITVVPENGVRFKTLGRNVSILPTENE